MKVTFIRVPRQQGFALPTILIASVILLTVLVSAVSATASVRAGLDSQYYNQLAKEASEAGLARAKECLASNNYVPQWSDRNLYPNTACTGGYPCTGSDTCYVMSRPTYRTTFSVDAPVNQNVSQLVKVKGTVELLRASNGDVWKSYSYSTSANVGIDLSFNTVTFGYSLNGAFFATIGADGEMRGTGYNGFGQLGNGSYASTLTPKEFNIPDGQKAVSAYASFLSLGWNMFAVTDQGNVYGSGYNATGQLGNGTTTSNYNIPVKFNLPAGKSGRFVGSLGSSTYVITTDNNIYAAGECANGRLGTSYTITGCANVTTPTRVALPTPTADPNSLPTDNIVLDRATVYVRMQGGRVYGWGQNDWGQLGNGATADVSAPIQIGTFGDTGKTKAVQVVFDGLTVFILDDAGDVYSTGGNNKGQRGVAYDNYAHPALEKYPLPASAGRVTKIATDQYSILMMTDTGQVWGSGWNLAGQLGNGSTADIVDTPVRFNLPAGVTAVDLYNCAAGSGTDYLNTFVIGNNGRIYGAGSNMYGQLGDGTTTDRPTPVAMNVINGTTIKAKQVQSGLGTTVVLTEDSKIYTVGNNNNGQLGDGTTTNSSTPKANRYTNVLPVMNF